MLKSDIDPAKVAAKYLDDTAAYDGTKVTAFVITAKQPADPGAGPGGNNPSVTIVVPSTAAVFANLLTAFSNAVSTKRTNAQTVLTNLGITG